MIRSAAAYQGNIPGYSAGCLEMPKPRFKGFTVQKDQGLTEHLSSASKLHMCVESWVLVTEDCAVQVYAMHFLTTSLEPQLAP